MAERTSARRWLVLSGLAAAGSAMVLRHVMERGYARASGKAPPKDPAAPDVAWRSAIGWTLATSVVIGVGRVLAIRATSAGLRRAGYLPEAKPARERRLPR